MMTNLNFLLCCTMRGMLNNKLCICFKDYQRHTKLSVFLFRQKKYQLAIDLGFYTVQTDSV